jgi:hypothetical protein
VGSKLTAEHCEQSSVELREYPEWTVGREWRRYRVGSALVEIHLEGWARNEVLAAHERGDTTHLPSFSFEGRRFSETGEPDWNMAGGHIEAHEIARRIREHGMDASTAAVDYVLGVVEQYL